MTQEVLKLALEALEAAEIDGNCEYGATEIIRKALAQPDLPQRTWVGLTEQDKWEILLATERDDRDDVMEMTEAKLKEKNT